MSRTIFTEPQWSWVGIDQGDTFSPLMSPDVEIRVDDDILMAQVNVPGEFHHFIDNIHGSECDVTGFFLTKLTFKRWFFCYEWVTPADNGSNCLWYWTESQLPGWARQALRGR